MPELTWTASEIIKEIKESMWYAEDEPTPDYITLEPDLSIGSLLSEYRKWVETEKEEELYEELYGPGRPPTREMAGG